MRRNYRVLAAALSLAPLPALAQEAPGFHDAQPQCTTTYTMTTKCTGAAAPLALPDAQQQPPAPPVFQPPPQYQQQPPQYQQPPQPFYPQQPYPAPVYTAPPGYVSPAPYALRPSHVELQANYGLMIAGASIFGGAYLWNVAGAYLGGDGRLAIPLVGPLMLINTNTDDGGDRTVNALLVFDSLIQTTGVVLFIAGAATKHKVTVYDSGNTHVTIIPTANLGGGGLATVGVF